MLIAKLRLIVFCAFLALVLVASAPAAELMPSLSDLSGWSVDRYDPNAFENVGAFQGRNDVLKIGIDSSDGLGSRPSGQNIDFYNTQGRAITVSGGVGDSVSADLYIPSSWADESNGSRRSDVWGLIGTEPGQASYPIIGFTNYGGSARLRYWDSTIGWFDLAVAVQYDAWTAFSFIYNGTSVDYYVNGAFVGSANVVPAAQNLSLNRVFLQAYNFNGTSFSPSAVPGNYEAYWANAVDTAVPEPGTMVFVGSALIGLALWRRRRPGSLA